MHPDVSHQQTDGVDLRLRHRPAGDAVEGGAVDVDVHASIAAIPAAGWSRLARGHGIYLSHDWLASVERSPLSHAVYLTAHIRGRLCGVLPLYAVEREDNPLYHAHSRYFAGIGAAEDWYPAVLAGTRTAYRNALLVEEGLPAPERATVLHGMLARAGEFVAAAGARSLLLSYLDGASLRLLGAVADAGPFTFLANLDMSIPTRGLTPATYLAQLGSHRRRRLAGDRRRFDAQGYVVEEPELGDFSVDGGPLVAHLCRSHGTPMTDEQGRQYLADIATSLPGRTKAYVARKDGVAMACSVCLVDDDAVYVRTYGYREGVQLRHNEYFVLCYDLPLSLALSRGIAGLHLGTGTYRPKILRGAQPEPLWTVCFGRPGTVRRVPAGWARRQRSESLAAQQREYGLNLLVPDLLDGTAGGLFDPLGAARADPSR
jgi:uncharacterized protein